MSVGFCLWIQASIDWKYYLNRTHTGIILVIILYIIQDNNYRYSCDIVLSVMSNLNMTQVYGR